MALTRAAAQYELRAAEFAKTAPDFKEYVQGIMSVFVPPDHVAERLLELHHGPRLAYELAMNIDALEELNALPPATAREAIAKLEGQLDGMAHAQTNCPPPRRVTRAPAPLRSMSGGSASPNFDPNTASMSEYVAKRKAGWG